MRFAAQVGLDRLRPSRETIAWGAVLVNAELLLVLVYLVGRGEAVTITRPEIMIVPFVWINVGLWAIVRTRPGESGRRKRVLAGAVGIGYFLVLAYVGGLVGPADPPARGLEVTVATLPPGWSPMVSYFGAAVDVTLIPYRLVGYLALAYLVYATALEASNALVGGLVGLFSCVSCTFPVVASLLTGVAGSGTAVASFALTHSYVISTVVFVVTVGLLYWRPFGT